MKINRTQIRNLVKEHFFKKNTLSKNDRVHFPVLDESIVDLNDNMEENFEVVNQSLLEETTKQIDEIKNINEELRRMKQLVDFRSPLMSKENL